MIYEEIHLNGAIRTTVFKNDCIIEKETSMWSGEPDVLYFYGGQTRLWKQQTDFELHNWEIYGVIRTVKDLYRQKGRESVFIARLRVHSCVMWYFKNMYFNVISSFQTFFIHRIK